MKTYVAQINPTVGDLKGNLSIIAQKIVIAQQDQCDVIIFPELATVGYPPRDLLYSRTLWENHPSVINEILKMLQNYPQMTVIVGGLHEQLLSGGRYARYNAAWILDRHYGKRVVHKRLLPCYDVFDETRYFTPETEPYTPIPIRIANNKGDYDVLCDVLICEDIWNNGFRSNEWMKPHTYSSDPVERLAGLGPLFVLNGSPFWINKVKETRELVESVCMRTQQPVVWCNQIGAHDDLVTGGYSMVSIPHLEKTATRMAPLFQESSMVVRLADKRTHHSNLNVDRDINAALEDPITYYDKTIESNDFDTWTIAKALHVHMHDYKRRCGFKQAVIGLSGGIDSAVVAVVAADVFGPENVIGIGMPSPHSSQGSIDDAEALAKNLKIRFEVKSIADLYESSKSVFLSGGKQKFTNPVTDENLQPRLRGMILMGYSNEMERCILLTTGNKSEISVGYCVSGDSLMATNKGIVTARDLFKLCRGGQNISSGSNNFIAAWNSYKDSMIEIKTRIGSTIVVSADHEVKIFDQETKTLGFKRAENVTVGDIVIQVIGQNIWGDQLTIPHFLYHKKEWDFKSVDFSGPWQIDNDTAQFLGVCIADGSFVGNGLYKIRLTKDKVRDFVMPYLKSLGLPKSCFGVSDKDENGCYFISISSVQFIAWLRHMGVKHGSKNKDVPGIILKAPKDIVISFLSGIMLDSTTDLKEKHGEITYHSVSKSLATYVHFCLLNMGILCYLRQWERSEQNSLHEVYIPASETQKLVNFSFVKPSLIDRIHQNADADRCKHKSFADDIYGHDSDIIETFSCIPWEKRRSLLQNLNKRGCIGRKTLAKHIEQVPDSEAKRRLLAALESNIYYIPVVSVEKFTDSMEMFDFSMSDQNEYVVNGVLVHNCTIYGDMCGGLAVISDVWKTQVYQLAKFYNKYRGEIIPVNTIEKPPSAELRPDQQDTDTLPEYDALDPILKMIVEDELTPREIMKLHKGDVPQRTWETTIGTTFKTPDIQMINKIYTMYRNSEFKRQQMPQGPKVQKRSFGSGRRMPLAMKLTTVSASD